jgi:uncharacterized Zn-binding protein involved in type VI secretion
VARQIIVVGDTLSPYGGEVIGGSGADNIDGRKIARKGDPVKCAEHGMNSIDEGDSETLVGERPVALEGHHASCGCALVSVSVTAAVA